MFWDTLRAKPCIRRHIFIQFMKANYESCGNGNFFSQKPHLEAHICVMKGQNLYMNEPC